MSVTIRTQDLVKKYGQRTVVDHVSFEVNQGEIVGLLGPNGAGKTTSFYQVVGLIRPNEGRVFINDEDITGLPMYKRAKMGIGYLPQEASVFRKLSVEDNIAAVLEMTSLTRHQQKEGLESLLDEFRLQHVRKSHGDVLSGGERRRTEIARALAVDPKFILLDEPFAGIDPIAVEDIQAIVAKLKYKNIGILITDHNVTETLSICDRAYLLIEGKIYKHGTAEELASDDEVKRLYLGRNFELKRKDWLHEEARGERKISFIPYVIDKINSILADKKEKRIDKPSFELLRDSILQKEFFGEWNNAIKEIEHSSLTNESGFKLKQYADSLREIDIEDQFEIDFWSKLNYEQLFGDTPFNTLEKIKAFDALRKGKELLEKSKTIIENPAWGKLLS